MKNNYNEGYFNLKNEAIITLKAHLFRTYSYLVSKDYNGTGVFYSQGRMAEELGICIRTLQRHLKELKQLGYIDSRRRGFNMTNIYTMLKNVVEKVKYKKEEIANNFKKGFSTNKNESKKLRFDNFTGRGAGYYGDPNLEKKLLGWE